MADSVPPNVYYRGGADLTPRPGTDVLFDRESGLLRTDRGISLSTDPALLERFGGAYRVESIPLGLRVIKRGHNVSHYELAPDVPMSLERYVALLAQVVLRLVTETQ